MAMISSCPVIAIGLTIYQQRAEQAAAVESDAGLHRACGIDDRVFGRGGIQRPYIHAVQDVVRALCSEALLPALVVHAECQTQRIVMCHQCLQGGSQFSGFDPAVKAQSQ